jgi:ephrin-B
MNRYEANFIEAGYKSTSDIRELAGEDLERLGVSLIGHRNKIMKSIKSLKNGKNKQSLRI